MVQAACRREALPQTFSGSAASQRGQVRWYLVHTPQGSEQSICKQIKRLVPRDLLEDAFVMQREYWFKRQGTWELQLKPMYRGYVFVATRDAAALDRALARLSLHVRIAGSERHAYQPMAPDAQAWFESVLDSQHVLRNSIACINNGVLSIQTGPLVGQEARVRKIDRRKRWCVVGVGEGDDAFSEVLPMDVPIKN